MEQGRFRYGGASEKKKNFHGGFKPVNQHLRHRLN